MSIVTLISELMRFIKNYFRKIVLGAFLIGLLVAGGRYFINQLLNADRLTAYQYLSKVYQQDPASLQIIVTMEDGSIFSTASVFDEYFSTPAVVEKIEKQTGINFGEWLEAERQLEMFKTTSYRGGLAAVRDEASNVITLRFLVAEKTEDNLKIAKAYQDILEQEALPFLRGNKISIIQPAAQEEMLALDLIESIPSKETLTPYQSREAKNSIVYGILGLGLGFILATCLSLINHLRKGKIVYAFDYTWNLDDLHFILDRDQTRLNLPALIQTPKQVERLLVRQSNLQNELDVSVEAGELFTDPLVHHLADWTDNKEIDEIVLIVDSQLTDKKWFQEQTQLAQLYPARLKIIQVN